MEALPLKDRPGGVRLLYSHNCQFGLSQTDAGDQTSMATIGRVFPALAALKAADDEHISIVNNGIVEEVLLPLGKLDFGKGVVAKCDVSLWRTRGEHKPLVGEFAFQVKFAKSDDIRRRPESSRPISTSRCSRILPGCLPSASPRPGWSIDSTATLPQPMSERAIAGRQRREPRARRAHLSRLPHHWATSFGGVIPYLRDSLVARDTLARRQGIRRDAVDQPEPAGIERDQHGSAGRREAAGWAGCRRWLVGMCLPAGVLMFSPASYIVCMAAIPGSHAALEGSRSRCGWPDPVHGGGPRRSRSPATLDLVFVALTVVGVNLPSPCRPR